MTKSELFQSNLSYSLKVKLNWNYLLYSFPQTENKTKDADYKPCIACFTASVFRRQRGTKKVNANPGKQREKQEL